MTVAAQLFAIFAFGLVVTGVVFLGFLRAKEVADRVARVESARGDRPGGA